MELDTECQIPHSAERVWALIADFGNLAWISHGLTRVETEGSGVGMLRRLYWDNTDIARVHRLESLDPNAMCLRYSMQNSMLPVSQFEIREWVEALDSQTCMLRRHISFHSTSEVYEHDLATTLTSLMERLSEDLTHYLQQHPATAEPPEG